jgi:ribosomal 30S subunit maturation factor RimM
MKPKNLMLTTALAAILAAPVAAQSDDGGSTSAEQDGGQGQIGSYSVGDFLDLAVVTSDGSEAGQVEAVIEGQDGSQVLVRLDDKTVSLPIDAFSMSEDGSEQLVIDRSMDELQQMAAFEPSGEMQFTEETRMSATMGEGDLEQGGDGSQQDMAQTEELDTTVVEDSPEDVTIVTTDPSAVETEDDAQMAEGDTGTGMTGEQDDTQMAEGDTGSGMTGEQDDAQMAEGDTGTGMTGEEDDTQMAEGDTGTGMTGEQDDAQMAEGDTGTDMTGEQAGASTFAGMTVGDILGMDVIAANGENVGEIDYIFQDQDGYQAVIGIGGFLGLGEHTVALPLSDFSIDQEQNALVLDQRTEEDLDAMPEIDETGLEGLENDHEITM